MSSSFSRRLLTRKFASSFKQKHLVLLNHFHCSHPIINSQQLNLLSSRNRYFSASTNNNDNDIEDLGDRESMEFDVVIVGGGPAGLSAAIRLKQLANESETPLTVCLLEKGAEIGSHIISGNVFNPIALTELIPDWQLRDTPLKQSVTGDEFWFLTESQKWSVPYLPPMIRNSGHYIISLGELCQWLAEEAESLEVDILPGFSASEPLFGGPGPGPGPHPHPRELVGVATSDMGLLKDGSPGPNFERGTAVYGRQTILAEGCRGSISEAVMAHFHLRSQCDPQIYGIGFKEVWQLTEDNAHYKPGLVVHALGHPLPADLYGGSFIYHAADHQVFIGCVMGLEYTNPYFNPYLEFQKLKKHPQIAPMLATEAACIGYGARALNEGGYQSIPSELSFAGGVLAGCSAGFVNVPKVKGAHYAMKSGILAAESIFEAIKADVESETPIYAGSHGSHGSGENSSESNARVAPPQKNVQSYQQSIHNSYIMKELYQVRNVKPSFNYGKIAGFVHSALSTTLTKGMEPWTLRNGYTCAEKTLPASECTPIDYQNEKPDGILTFDLLTNLSRTATMHEESEPSHLKIKPELAFVAEHESYDIYGGPETRFCPAKVYEFVENADTQKMELMINSQNCIHCKTCSIKTPKEYIQWTVPQGGGGPKYAGM